MCQILIPNNNEKYIIHNPNMPGGGICSDLVCCICTGQYDC